MAAIAREQGFDAPPRIGSVDEVIAAGGLEIFRGVRTQQLLLAGEERARVVTGEEYATAFREGPAFYGDGIQGSGIYFTTSRSRAQDRYSIGFLEGGAVIRAALSPEARTITRDEIREQFRANPELAAAMAQDEGAYAALLGYDAVLVPRSDEHFVILLNRTAATVDQPDGWAEQVSARLPRPDDERRYGSREPETPGARLAAMVPVDASPYGETKPSEVQQWAQEHLEYEDPSGQVRSVVRGSYVTRSRDFDRVSLSFTGEFRSPPDDYYKQGRPEGNWSFHITISGGRAVAEIDGIDLRYDLRGQGIGSHWVEFLEQALQGEGIQQVRLFDVSHAHRGTSFWEGRGYERRGDVHVKDLT